jgi:putative addiction module component (TIGR02574 family)
MTMPVDDLEAEVLGLPPEDRARLLERLIQSFEPDSRVRDAWVALALKREAELKSGKVKLVAGAESVARIRARLA